MNVKISFFNTLPVKCAVLAAAGFLTYKLFFTRLTRQKNKRYILIDDFNDWNNQEDEIIKTLKESHVLGLDCEWVTIDNSRKPVSLLQLANDTGFCVLVRLSKIPVWMVPIWLSELLEDENILKVGVGVHDDANKLYQDYFLEVRGCVDLRFLAQDLREIQNSSLGLKNLAAVILGLDLDKSKNLRCSDWEVDTLTDLQVRYAADDAIVAAELFTKIKRLKSGWFFAWSFWNEVKDCIDVPFKISYVNTTSTSQKKPNSTAALKSRKIRYSKPRQKPMYDNCQLTAPDGEVLCSCDRGKAEWYVSKGLGETIREDPFTVQLNFEPSGRPTLDNVFYTKEKSNCCVVCGSTENFHRKLVIPSEYRRYFPNLMKKNLSHDVLLLCVRCHKRSNILDQDMRLKLAELCDAPLGSGKNIKYQINPALARVKSAATALVNSGFKIPEPRRKELEQVIKDYYDIQIVTDEVLTSASNSDVCTLNSSFVPHGLKVYEYFCKNGGLIQFEKMWRQHFLDTMNPNFLPSMWSVEHNHKRLALQVVNHEREVNFDESILGLSSELVKEIEALIT